MIEPAVQITRGFTGRAAFNGAKYFREAQIIRKMVETMPLHMMHLGHASSQSEAEG